MELKGAAGRAVRQRGRRGDVNAKTVDLSLTQTFPV